jgi:hypothetical protein
MQANKLFLNIIIKSSLKMTFLGKTPETQKFAELFFARHFFLFSKEYFAKPSGTFFLKNLLFFKQCGF